MPRRLQGVLEDLVAASDKRAGGTVDGLGQLVELGAEEGDLLGQILGQILAVMGRRIAHGIAPWAGGFRRVNAGGCRRFPRPPDKLRAVRTRGQKRSAGMRSAGTSDIRTYCARMCISA